MSVELITIMSLWSGYEEGFHGGQDSHQVGSRLLVKL